MGIGKNLSNNLANIVKKEIFQLVYQKKRNQNFQKNMEWLKENIFIKP